LQRRLDGHNDPRRWSSMDSSTFTLQAADAASIHVFKWVPDAGTQIRAVVQLSHGLAEHAGRYARLAEALTAAGYAVYANDHRGHGVTASDDEVGTFAPHDGWHKVVNDLHLLNGRIRREQPGVPVIVMGHSMGSLLVQNLLFAHPKDADACVLSGTSGKPPAIATVGKLVARLERLRLGPTKGSKLLDTMGFGAFNKAFAPNRTASDWLSRDPVEVDKYLHDKRCGFLASAQLWMDLLGGLSLISRPDRQAQVNKALPMYMFAGARDPVGQNTASIVQLIAAYKDAGLTNITSKFYPEARHETLNEINRDEVTADLVGWLNGVIRI
jgi:alpha-beta hydrolase superfamily lysophospholipase